MLSLILAAAATLTPEQRAALVPVDALFAALAAHDAAAATAVLLPGGSATVATEKTDGSRSLRRLSFEQFTAGLKPSTDIYSEVMPNPIVRIDGDIAMVWGHYTFTLNGTLHHCGVDHFDLVRDGEQWKVANISWSSRTAGCAKPAGTAAK